MTDRVDTRICNKNMQLQILKMSFCSRILPISRHLGQLVLEQEAVLENSLVFLVGDLELVGRAWRVLSSLAEVYLVVSTAVNIRHLGIQLA